jgi:Uma2 family endonuclease
MVEIKLPEAKPAFEWVNGRALQKVSPKFQHGLAQLRFAAALDVWARKNRTGSVATEWRFHIQPPDEIRRPLVPDVAFLSYKRLPYSKMLVTQEPTVAPDAVIEVQSPRDRRSDIDDKVRVYLTAGTNVVFLVDPTTKTVTICDATGERHLKKRDIIHHSSLPGFRLAVKSLFELTKPK